MKAATKDLKALVAKVQRGIGNNPLMPLSSLVSIAYNGQKTITLKTFDGYNYVVSHADIAEAEGAEQPFEVCVGANTFVALVNKTSSEGISLALNPKYLAFKGNGNYKLDVVTDNGELLRFPTLEDFSDVAGTKVKVSILNNSITVNEPSAAKTAEVAQFLGCYFGKGVYTTNGQVACVVSETLMEGESALFMYNTMKMLPSLADQEAILKVKQVGEDRLFELSDTTVTISGKLIGGAEMYPVAALDRMVGTPMKTIKVKVAELLDVLDRMNIFTDQYQTNAIRLRFANENLTITNVALGSSAYNAEETIDAPWAEDGLPHEEGEEPYECFVDLAQLQADLKVCSTPEALIGYGSDRYVRVSEGKVNFIVALLELK